MTSTPTVHPPHTPPPPSSTARPIRAGGAPRAPLAVRVSAWSARHRLAAISAWLLLVVAAIAVGALAGGEKADQRDPGEAGRAQQALQDGGQAATPREQVLVRRPSGGAALADAEVRSTLRELTDTLRALPGSARGVSSALTDKTLTSVDGHAGLVTFEVPGDDDTAAVAPAQAAVARVAARHPGLVVAQAGDASIGKAIEDQVGDDLARAEKTSLPLTLVVLLLVFGSLVAAGIPVLLAGTAVAAAVSLMAVPGRWLPLDDSTSSVVVLVGMAVGVDYSLFYLRREREERALGRTPHEALQIAAATSGRAVVTAGLTVMAALAGLFLSGVDVFQGMAIGTIVVVGLAVLAAVTVLPATLALLGDRVEALRVPGWGRRRREARPSRFWTAVVRRVVVRPRLAAVLAAGGLLGLAAVGLGLPTQQPPVDVLARGTAVEQGLRELTAAFPGGTAPAVVAITGTGAEGEQGRRVAQALVARAGERPELFPGAARVRPQAAPGLLVVDVPLAGDGDDATSTRALRTLRADVVPAALAGTGLHAAVGGPTAAGTDFVDALHARQWWVVGFVLALALVLLVRAFGSPALAVTAIALTALSVACSYGVLSLVFEHGLLDGWGVQSYGAVIPWLPLFMFVLLFGLTMDYQVFLLSRIREVRARGESTREAIVTGIGGSAGTITSAAVIMIAVFSVFALLDFVPMAMFGIGMAVAIAVDATVIRGVLLPAVMTLLGERNWRVPGWLPRVLRPAELVEVSAER